MVLGRHAAVGATSPRLHGSALRLLRRHVGQSGISSMVKTIEQLLRNELSRLHPVARWRLLRGRGGLTRRRRRSSIPVLRPAVLFYKSKLSRLKAESPLLLGFLHGPPLIHTGCFLRASIQVCSEPCVGRSHHADPRIYRCTMEFVQSLLKSQKHSKLRGISCSVQL
jgi:hypothetical protein